MYSNIIKDLPNSYYGVNEYIHKFVGTWPTTRALICLLFLVILLVALHSFWLLDKKNKKNPQVVHLLSQIARSGLAWSVHTIITQVSSTCIYNSQVKEKIMDKTQSPPPDSWCESQALMWWWPIWPMHAWEPLPLLPQEQERCLACEYLQHLLAVT